MINKNLAEWLNFGDKVSRWIWTCFWEIAQTLLTPSPLSDYISATSLNFARKLATNNICQLSWIQAIPRTTFILTLHAAMTSPDRIRNLINAQVHAKRRKREKDLHSFLARFALKIEILSGTKKTETRFSSHKSTSNLFNLLAACFNERTMNYSSCWRKRRSITTEPPIDLVRDFRRHRGEKPRKSD